MARAPRSPRNPIRMRQNDTGATGLEPATSGVTGRRSNQLSYAPERTRWADGSGPVAKSSGFGEWRSLPGGLDLAGVEAEAGQGLDQLELLVGEMGEQGVGEEVDGGLEGPEVGGVVEVADEGAVDGLDRVVDD
jgi:hypothetical protein